MELSFAWRERRTERPPPPPPRRWPKRRIRGLFQTPRRFLDFQVDGRSLYDAFGDQHISCLGWFTPEEDERSAQRLLLREPPDPDLDGRVAIYVCAECGDILCGAITAVIEEQDQKIVWRDVARSNPNWRPEERFEWVHEPVTSISDLEFDTAQYSAAIENRPRTDT